LRRGLYNLEPKRLGFGGGVDGAMAQFFKIPESCLHRLPGLFRFQEGGPTEPCCVAYHPVCVNLPISGGDSVAVIGPGPIGLLCAIMARLSGAGHVLVIGVAADAGRLEVARQVGAQTTLGAHNEDVADWVRNFRDGYGFDLVIDAAGVSASLK